MLLQRVMLHLAFRVEILGVCARVNIDFFTTERGHNHHCVNWGAIGRNSSYVVIGLEKYKKCRLIYDL